MCVWRDDSQSLGTGSYVWFDKSKLAVLGVVDMVGRIPESGIPNADFPSDHLSLKAVFSFLPIEGQVVSDNLMFNSEVILVERFHQNL